MNRVNEEALKLAVKAIEASPENWDQSHWKGIKLPAGPKAFSWEDVEHVGPMLRLKPGLAELYGDKFTEWVEVERCTTTYCLAGQVLLQAGMIDGRGRYTAEDGTPMDNWQIEQRAAELLGLDKDQAEDLFYWGVNHGGGTLADFKAHITRVTGVRFEDE